MNEDRLDRLRSMLLQIDPSGTADELKKAMKSTGRKGAGRKRGGPKKELAGPAVMDRVEAEKANDSYDRLMAGRKVDEDHRNVLEAIVMPFFRPVVDIVGNAMVREQLSPTWQHLGDDAGVRSAIEETFLSIGRIEIPHHPSLPYAGSGFIVGDNLLMTNRHVAGIFASGIGIRHLNFLPGQTAGIDFLQEFGRTASDVLKVDKVLMIHPHWDMALLLVSGLPSNRVPLTLSTADPTNLEERQVIAVGYPGYDPGGDRDYQDTQHRIFRGAYYVKRMQPGVLRVRSEIESFGHQVAAITHDCSTLGGNSGSAVLVLPTSPMEPIEVVGLHFAGAYLRANYAVPTHDLAQDSRVVSAGVNFSGRIEPRGDFYGPIWTSVEADQPGEAVNNASPGTLVQSPGIAGGMAGGSAVSACNWTIPINISVSIGTPHQAAAPGITPGIAITPGAPAEGLFSRAPSFSAAQLARMFDVNSLSAEGFNWRTALSAAVASNLAYDNSGRIVSTATNSWGLQTCEFISRDDTQCFVASSSDAVLIAFRGTESLGDWLGNLNAFSVTRPYGEVHGGFLTAMTAVRSQLEEQLNRLPELPIIMTGHSLGGALAMIAAAEWHGSFPIRSVYTYGKPGVGKGAYPAFIRRHYDNAIFRFVNDDDIVPMVPPSYRHVGRLFHFNSGNGVRVRNESLESTGVENGPETMSQSQFDLLRAQLLQQNAQRQTVDITESVAGPQLEGLFPSFSDHKLTRYIQKVSNRVR